MVRRVTLAQLVAWGAMSETVASLLSAAVRARLGIVVSGQPGDGSTTLLRALCAEIDPLEVIGTFETEYELFLHEEERTGLVHAWAARGGQGAESEGPWRTADQILDSFRFRLDRGILGEVRAAEVWPMIKLTESGVCSMSTTHADSAQQAIDKLISSAVASGGQISRQAAGWKLAEAVHLVVQLACELVRDPDDPSKVRKHRYVAEIAEVVPGENEAGYATNVIFRREPGRCAVAAMPPDRLLERLTAHGFDVDAFTAEVQANRQQPRGL
jgi:Flp pilus assembly CpaF family ATPase